MNMDNYAADQALRIAEELLNIIPDTDSEVTDAIYDKMLEKATELDAIKDQLQ